MRNMPELKQDGNDKIISFPKKSAFLNGILDI